MPLNLGAMNHLWQELAIFGEDEPAAVESSYLRCLTDLSSPSGNRIFASSSVAI